MNYDELLAPAAKAMRPSGIRKFFDLAADMPHCISLGVGEPDFKTPWSVRDAGIRSLELGRTKYTANAGLKDLRKEICTYLQRRFELHYQEENVLVTVGGSEAIDLAIRALVQPGDEVIIPEPCFVCYEPITQLTGGVPVHIATRAEDQFRLTADQLRAAITPKTKLLIFPYPNNPTGALMSKELLGSIVEIARGVGAYILCDEVYRHLTQEDEWCESIVDLYEKGISVSSMSKVFSLAGLRMGWIATHDEAARKAFLSHRDYNLISCGMFDDAIASIALRHSDVMLKRNQRIVRENLAILDDWIKENPHFFYTKPKAGTTALVYYDFDIPSYEFCKRMYHETGAFVTPGDCFEQPHSMRVGYACDVNTLRDGLAAVTKFAATL